MVRRGGMRRVVRWGGVALLVVLAGVWGASLFGYLAYIPFKRSSNAPLVVRGWCLREGEFETWMSAQAPGFNWARWETGGWDGNIKTPLPWLPSFEFDPLGARVGIPLWIPWLLAMGFTVCRFRADRVKPPHACPSCGYDKTGLAPAAPCPECGAAAPTVPSN